MAEPLPIRHVAQADRGEFVMERDSERVGELHYTISGSRLTIDHTAVDPSLRGQGAARRLLDAAVAFARAQGYKIVPRCSYASAVFARSPAHFADVLER